jgi:Domain of unknown function (DUF4340)
MNRKTFGILLAVAAVFVVLAIVGQGPSGSRPIAGDSAGMLLLPALTDDLDGVDEILVAGAGQERLVSLERSDDSWTVVELDGYDADRSKVNSLLIALSEARIVEEKTADPEYFSRLGVEAIDLPDATGLELDLVAANGDRYSVVLGDTYTGGQRYARIANENLSVLIDRNPNVARDPADWVASEIINVATDRVQRVEISHADGEHLVMHKDARGETNFAVDGVPEGRELQYAGVANVTGSLLQGLRLDGVRRRSTEAAEPSAVTEFRTFDGLVVSVSVATEGDESWLAFDARFDAEQALRFATETVTDDIAGAAPSDGDDDAAAETDAEADTPQPQADAMAEAESIDGRLGDWQFRIPSYQLSQLTRRMQDLLRPESDE